MALGDNQIDGYTEGEEPLLFHYKKGDFRRLEDKKYSDMATGQNQPKKGLIRVLLNTKGNRILFFVMVVCIALVFILNFIKNKSNVASLNHINCTLTAFSYEDSVYASLEVDPNKNSPFNIPLNITCTFKFYDSDGSLLYEEEKNLLAQFTSADDKSLFMRSSVTDFNVVKVQADLSMNDASFTDSATCKVSQR